MLSPRSAPLADAYAVKVAMVLLALCPFIVITTASFLMQAGIAADLHTTTPALELAGGLSDAGYAFGAVVAVAFIKRLPPRPLLLSYEALFVAGSVVAAVAPGIVAFTAGRILEGLATGLLLVAALPPLVTRFPVAKLPLTAAVVDIGLFGATTVGPLVGGFAGAHHAWRLTFWLLAAAGAAGLIVGALSVEQGRPLDPDGRIDRSGIVLAGAATVLPFFATSELAGHALISPVVLPALIAGLAALGALVYTQYRRRDALTPVRLLAHTLPVTGILMAMATGAGAVALLELAEDFLLRGTHTPVLETGALFWPQVAGVAVAAGAFGVLFRSRRMPGLIVAGTAALGAGAVILGIAGAGTGHAAVLAVAACVGFGAGATVSPGLFLAALSVPSSELGPAFALVELLRSEAAFLVAPILAHVAMWHGESRAALGHGISVASWTVLIILAVTLATCALLWRAGGARTQSPDLGHWLDEGAEAVESPPIGARLR